MSGSVTYAPFLPWEVLAALAALAILLLALAAWRGLRGWFLRGLAALVLLAAIANPSYRQEQRNPLADVAFLVIDETASQTLPERTAQLEQARAKIAEAFSNRIDPPLEIITVPVRDTPEDAKLRGTLLLQALREAAADIAPDRIAGAVVISDGRIHDLAPMTDFPAPVHLLQTGRPTDWDRRITLENAPAFGIVGENVTLTLRIEDTGAVPDSDGLATVIASVDGGPPQTVRLPVGRSVPVDLPITHAGANLLTLETPAVDGEITDRNNRTILTVNGIRDRLRVLLVSGEPYAGERTWRNLLKADAAVDLVHFTILRAPDKQDGVPVTELSLIAFPTRELFMDKIQEFDLIIFDRYRLRGILPDIYLQNIVRYVEGGGAILVTTGPGFAGVESLARSSLGTILPALPTGRIYTEGFLPRVSGLGRRHPVTAGLEALAYDPAQPDIPKWGRWFRQIDLAPRSGNVVMEGVNGQPLLMLDRVGEGRIALLASDQVWLWSRGVEGGGPQAELLRRLAHWLMKEPELEEEVLSATASGEQVTVTRRSLGDVPTSIQFTAPSGQTGSALLQQKSEGDWQAIFTASENGIYTITNGDQKTLVAVGPAASREYEQPVGASPDLLSLVGTTGGGVFPIAEGIPDVRRTRFDRIAAGNGWLGLPRRDAYTVQDIRLTPLAPGWLVLLLIAALSLWAWRFESR